MTSPGPISPSFGGPGLPETRWRLPALLFLFVLGGTINIWLLFSQTAYFQTADTWGVLHAVVNRLPNFYYSFFAPVENPHINWDRNLWYGIFQLIYSYFDLNYRYFLVFNFIIYGLTAVLVYSTVFHYTKNFVWSYASGVAFTISASNLVIPMYVVYMGDILILFLNLLTLRLFLSRSLILRILSLLVFYLALRTKEYSMVLPFGLTLIQIANLYQRYGSSNDIGLVKRIFKSILFSVWHVAPYYIFVVAYFATAGKHGFWYNVEHFTMKSTGLYSISPTFTLFFLHFAKYCAISYYWGFLSLPIFIMLVGSAIYLRNWSALAFAMMFPLFLMPIIFITVVQQYYAYNAYVYFIIAFFITAHSALGRSYELSKKWIRILVIVLAVLILPGYLQGVYFEFAGRVNSLAREDRALVSTMLQTHPAVPKGTVVIIDHQGLPPLSSNAVAVQGHVSAAVYHDMFSSTLFADNGAKADEYYANAKAPKILYRYRDGHWVADKEELQQQ